MKLDAGSYLLRKGFVLQQGRQTIRGPAMVTLTADEARDNAHKIEVPPKAKVTKAAE